MTIDLADVAVVLTTIGADADAVALARTLVDEGLAACVNVLPPMQSVYRWQGAVQVEREQQLVIKTAPANLAGARSPTASSCTRTSCRSSLCSGADASVAYAEWVAGSARECRLCELSTSDSE